MEYMGAETLMAAAVPFDKSPQMQMTCFEKVFEKPRTYLTTPRLFDARAVRDHTRQSQSAMNGTMYEKADPTKGYPASILVECKKMRSQIS